MVARSGAPDKLTLWAALKDLGWLPFMLMGIGGLSIINILEQIVFHDLTLVTPFQIVLSGYQRITDLIGAVIEPLFEPVVRLHPVWRPLFLLEMVWVISFIRSIWHMGRKVEAISGAIVMGLGSFSASALGGLVPTDGAWWAQGLVAAAPTAMLGSMSWAGIAQWAAALSGTGGNWLGALSIPSAAFFGASAFAVATGLSQVPSVGASSGIMVLIGFVALIGFLTLQTGLSRADQLNSRQGLSILGGFVAAGLILLSNWAVTALS